jgi:hypothetical protein
LQKKRYLYKSTIKASIMNAVELRNDLHQLIDQLDERFLKAVYAMISVYQADDKDPILGYETDGTPVTVSAFIKQAESAVAEAKKGKAISVEELEKRSKEWLGRTK